MIASRQNIGASASALVVDLGNSRLHAARYDGEKLSDHFDVPGDALDEFAVRLMRLWHTLPGGYQRRVVIASVVPQMLEALSQRLISQTAQAPLVVGKDVELPVAVAVERPDRVGTDRVCAAAAAFAMVQRCCAIADFGTALTIDLVGDDGVFMGGTILPGHALQARSLHEHTACLPSVDPYSAVEVPGLNTEAAMVGGIFYGLIGALREIVERYATRFGRWPHLIATGGAADLVAKHADFVDAVIPDLCLQGIGIAFRQHLDRQT